MRIRSPYQGNINELRRLTSHIVNFVRHEAGFVPGRRSDFGLQTPRSVIENLIPGPDFEKEKSKFLKLAHEKAKISLAVTAVMDKHPETERSKDYLFHIWGLVNDAARGLAFLFMDLKRHSMSKRSFGEKLETSIQGLLKHFKKDLEIVSFVKIPDKDLKRPEYTAFDILEKIPEAHIPEVLSEQNFVTKDHEQSDLKKQFAKAMDAIKSLRLEHQSLGVEEPINWIKSIIEMAKVEARLYPCISDLATKFKLEPK